MTTRVAELFLAYALTWLASAIFADIYIYIQCSQSRLLALSIVDCVNVADKSRNP